MKIRWHKGTDPRFGYRYWYAEAEVVGRYPVRVAEARMTSHTGTEDYPWEWFYTDEGEKMRIAGRVGRAKAVGVAPRLKDVKDMVTFQLGASE